MHSRVPYTLSRIKRQPERTFPHGNRTWIRRRTNDPVGKTARHSSAGCPQNDSLRRRCHNDLQEATERGACGIAIVLVQELTGKIVIERSKKGPGFDYWLGDSDDDLLFSGKARLEVSGILSGTAGQIEGRLKQKKDQIRPSDRLAPGYIAIVEFGAPMAHVEVKCTT